MTRTTGCPNEDKFCKGFMIKFENQESFFKIYPFHRHCSGDSSLQLTYNVSMNYDNLSKCEMLVAHSTACNRLLCDPEMASDVNKCSSDIEHLPQFKKMIEVGSKSDLPSQSKLEVCNYQQLQSRYLYYTILYYTILYYTILYYTILCYTILYIYSIEN